MFYFTHVCALIDICMTPKDAQYYYIQLK